MSAAQDEVTIAPGALHTLGSRVRALAPAHRYAIITDDTVGPLYAERAMASFGTQHNETQIFTMPSGESAKTRQTWGKITDAMLARGLGRDTTVIALGGGVVGDLAGFVAATYLRGVPFIQVPTTLLAMIDASIGGKTGVDTPAGKNLVGAFHWPSAVIIDPDTLSTLPPRHYIAGLAEAIKHGVIADGEYFETVLTCERRALITRSVEIKRAVVARDARESGVRKMLNFGHTIGHAIEAASEYTLLHGEAIAIGMVLETQLAERIEIAERGTATRVKDMIARAKLPTAMPQSLDLTDIVQRTHADKKTRAGAVEYALPTRIGAMAGENQGWGMPVGDDVVEATLKNAR